MWIQIRGLHLKPAELDLRCFLKKIYYSSSDGQGLIKLKIACIIGFLSEPKQFKIRSTCVTDENSNILKTLKFKTQKLQYVHNTHDCYFMFNTVSCL